MSGVHWNEGNLPDPATETWVEDLLDNFTPGGADIEGGAYFEVILSHREDRYEEDASGGSFEVDSPNPELLISITSSIERLLVPLPVCLGWGAQPSWDKVDEIQLRVTLSLKEDGPFSFIGSAIFGVSDGGSYSSTTDNRLAVVLAADGNVDFFVESEGQPNASDTDLFAYSLDTFYTFDIQFKAGSYARLYVNGELESDLTAGSPVSSTPVVPFFHLSGTQSATLTVGELRILVTPKED